jgi:hypothetical protein
VPSSRYSRFARTRPSGRPAARGRFARGLVA